jgi:hypothetical protein
MTRLLILVCACVLVLSTTATAQIPGKLSLTADRAGSSCAITDDEPGTLQVHLWVTDVSGLGAIQFAAPKPNCWHGAVWLGDIIPEGLTIGDTQFNDYRGLSIAFGCADGGRSGPLYLGSILFEVSGQATPCCPYRVVKVPSDLYPEIDGPIMVQCDGWEVVGVSVDAVVNPDPTCPCLVPTPVQETTWGQVKAFYE